MEKGAADVSNPNYARNVELWIQVQNFILPDDLNLYVASASYADNEENSADDFQLTFDDRERSMLGDWINIHPKIVKGTQEVERQVRASESVNYVVKRGDTLSGIASKYLGSPEKYKQIASENNIRNPNLIYPGQVFKITTNAQVTTTAKEMQETSKKGAEPKLITVKLVQNNWESTGTDAILECGTFEVDSIDMSGPPTQIALKSTSIPYTSTMRIEKKSRAWEKITLKAIAEQIAMESGMQLMYESTYNPTFKRKEQVQKSDIKFLQETCTASGLILKVTALTVVIYDAAEYDGKPPIETLEYGKSNIISYKFGTSLTDTAYTSCHVSYTAPDSKKTIEYTYTPDSSKGTGQTLEINERVGNAEEAKQLAMKRLRQKNTQEFTGNFTLIGNVKYVVGATVMVKGFQEFDRKYKITSAKHSITGGYKVDITLQQVLEGY